MKEMSDEKLNINKLAIAALASMVVLVAIVQFVGVNGSDASAEAASPQERGKGFEELKIAQKEDQTGQDEQGEETGRDAEGNKTGHKPQRRRRGQPPPEGMVATTTTTLPYFPRTVRLPVKGGKEGETVEYTLIGQGVRKVSFLKVEVYVVGMYAATASLDQVQKKLIKFVAGNASALLPEEQEHFLSHLLHPARSEVLWHHLLNVEDDTDFKTSMRIVPLKNTDFAHLRDGLSRGVRQKIVSLRRLEKDGVRADLYDDGTFGTPLSEFHQILGAKGSAPTGSVLTLVRDGRGALDVLYQGNPDGKDEDSEHFGSVADPRLANLMWQVYLGGENPASWGARRDIAHGLVELVKRPIGTAETAVI